MRLRNCDVSWKHHNFSASWLWLTTFVETFAKVRRILPQRAPPINTTAVLKILLNHSVGKAKQALKSYEQKSSAGCVDLGVADCNDNMTLPAEGKLLPQGSRYEVHPRSGLTLARCIPQSPSFFSSSQWKYKPESSFRWNITGAEPFFNWRISPTCLTS